jgi:hypothetical protein
LEARVGDVSSTSIIMRADIADVVVVVGEAISVADSQAGG